MKWTNLLVLSVLSICITACAKEQPISDNKSNSIEATAEPTPTNEPSPTNQQVAHDNKLSDEESAQLGDLLVQMSNTFGIATDLPEYNDYSYGITYTKFLDFNNDERGDFLTIFRGGEHFENLEEKYLQDSYILEVWTVDEGKEKNLLFMPLEDPNEQYETYKISIVKLPTGEHLIKEYVKFADGANDERTEYTVIEDNEATGITLMHEKADNTFIADGHVIHEEVYNETIKKYEGEETVIIDSKDGVPFFVKQNKTPAQMTSDVITQLHEPTLKQFETLEQVDGYTVQAEVEYSNQIAIADIHDSTKHFNMFAYILFYEVTEPDLPEEDFYIVYSEQLIRSKFYEVFGAELETNLLSLPTLTDDLHDDSTFYQGDGLFFYENEKFYMHPVDFPSSTVIRTVEAAYKLSDSTYYIVTNELNFDDYSYSMVTEDYIESSEFIYTDINTWDDKERYWATSGMKKYIVMTVQSGQPTFQYVSNQPLSLEEAKSYILK